MFDEESSNGSSPSSEPESFDRITALENECAELRKTVEELREENCLLKKALSRALCEFIEIDKEAMLREASKEPSIESLLAEFEREGN